MPNLPSTHLRAATPNSAARERLALASARAAATASTECSRTSHPVRRSCTISGIPPPSLHGSCLDHCEPKAFLARAVDDGIAGRNRRPRIAQMSKETHAAFDATIASELLQSISLTPFAGDVQPNVRRSRHGFYCESNPPDGFEARNH